MSRLPELVPFPESDYSSAREEWHARILWAATQDGISSGAFRLLFVMLQSGLDWSDRDFALLFGKSERTIANGRQELLEYGPRIEAAYPKKKSTPPERIQVTQFYLRDKIPWDLRIAVYERDRYRCVECGRATHLTIDHCVAVTSGGETIMENLRTLCVRCNVSKGAKNVRPVS